MRRKSARGSTDVRRERALGNRRDTGSNDQQPTARRSQQQTHNWRRWRAPIVLLLGAVLGALVIAHTPGLNGPPYWQWPWRRTDALRLVPLVLAAAVPFFLAQLLVSRGVRARVAVWLLALSSFLLMLSFAGLHHRPISLVRVADVVSSPIVTSYFTDARSLLDPERGRSVGELLRKFPNLLPRLNLHSHFKPPGPILFFALFVSLTGPTAAAALLAGLTLGVLASIGVVATFHFLHRLAGDEQAAFAGASAFALCPSLVLIFPGLDQAYPLLAAVMCGLWWLALVTGRVRHAVVFALLLALGLFFSYIFLFLGVFMVGAMALRMRGRRRLAMARVVKLVATAGLTIAGAYLALWLAAGFDPLQTFEVIRTLQAAGQAQLVRPYPAHLLFDFLDFAMGCGWLTFVLAASFLVTSRRKPRSEAGPVRALALLALLQVGIVFGLGLLPGESARLYQLLYPLLMLPVGLELARWTARERLVAYAAMLFVTSAMGQNLQFL